MLSAFVIGIEDKQRDTNLDDVPKTKEDLFARLRSIRYNVYDYGTVYLSKVCSGKCLVGVVSYQLGKFEGWE